MNGLFGIHYVSKVRSSELDVRDKNLNKSFDFRSNVIFTYFPLLPASDSDLILNYRGVRTESNLTEDFHSQEPAASTCYHNYIQILSLSP